MGCDMTFFVMEKDLRVDKYTVFYNRWCNSLHSCCSSEIDKILNILDRDKRIKCEDYADIYKVDKSFLEKIREDTELDYLAEQLEPYFLSPEDNVVYIEIS